MSKELSLVISNQSEEQFQHIDWNKQEFIELVKSITEQYQGLTYTDDQMKLAKSDRAKLNTMKKAVSDRRIEVKKAIMAPYEQFEREVKEVVELIEEPINMIDAQIKQYEEHVKEEKKKALAEFFTEEAKEYLEFLSFDAIFDKKYLNATVSLNKAKEEIKSKIVHIGMDVSSIKNFASEKYYKAAMDVYKKTLDVNAALSEDKRLSEFDRKAEEERKQREAREEERKRAEEEKRRQAEEDRIQREARDAERKKVEEEERRQAELEQQQKEVKGQPEELMIETKQAECEQEQLHFTQGLHGSDIVENTMENKNTVEHNIPNEDAGGVCIEIVNAPSLQWCDLLNMRCCDMDVSDFRQANCDGDCEVCCHYTLQQLKPCPFCGETVLVHGGSEEWKPMFGDPYHVACNCGLHFSIGSYEITDFFEAWNKRWSETIVN